MDYIRHFQYGGVCLHFYARCFNFVYGKFKFKITLVFGKITRHFDNIVWAIRNGLVKLS